MPLHACANCRWFVNATGRLRCMKPDLPPVLDANAGNRCKEFEFTSVDAAVAGRSNGGSSDSRQRTPREQWERLFGAE